MVGIDEAGRGALAGPLFMAACELQKALPGLKDSKKLSPKKRAELFEEISLHSKYLILAFSHTQIDTLGLSKCLSTGLEIIKMHFKNKELLYDGNTNFKVEGIKTLIKADDKVEAVSAASILAKVSRDKLMSVLALNYKEYGFEKHKGYASKAHIEAISKHGYSSLHRQSFKLKCFEKGLFD